MTEAEIRVTVSDVMSWRPCYSHARVKELFAGRESLSALEILDLEIPAEDCLWAVLREQFLSSYQLRQLAADFAERVLPIFEARYPDDRRPRLAIEAARGAADAYAYAAASAAYAADAAYAAADAADAARSSEREWQLNRVREYLRGER